MAGTSTPTGQPVEANDPFGLAKFSPRRNTVKITGCLVAIILLLIANVAQTALAGETSALAIPIAALAVAVVMIWTLVRVSIRTVEGEIWIRRLGMGDLEYRV